MNWFAKGQRFGRLTVLNRAGGDDWFYRCDCGKTATARGTDLRSGRIKSCGCLHRSRWLDLAGERFGRFLVLHKVGSIPHGSMWYCRCDCGNYREVRGNKLRLGLTRSCGCLNREVASARAKARRKPDAVNRHPLYGTWNGMKSRCTYPSDRMFHRYGGGGAQGCKGWGEWRGALFVCEWEEEHARESTRCV